MAKFCLEHFSVLKSGILNNVLFHINLLSDVKHFHTKSEVSLGFIADKITKGNYFSSKKMSQPGPSLEYGGPFTIYSKNFLRIIINTLKFKPMFNTHVARWMKSQSKIDQSKECIYLRF